ncbi:phosphatase PAP2 family protein [Chitinimonas koreensis]|uniref:phosphatase PAP2 family protein n=1 Tax=Chitinimonas koreensis TaxID=356302 RepID=UPI00041539A7|nr:phosphatase PAP2 family protein [Chitinimonas koreensis]QNM94780.1 phosphatase PAP2 family protein [Chitinimonas koreensis]
MRLPAITAANRLPALVLGYLLFCALYLGSYALGRGRAVQLEAGLLDRWLPDWPASLWLYLSQFLLLPLAFLLEWRSARLTRAYYAMLAATLASCAVFVAWPTTVGQAMRGGDALTAAGWQALYALDVAGNCFPSLHVALSLLAAGLLMGRGGLWCVAAPAWAAAIALSVLTTRQHRAIDVAGGAAVALLGAWIARRLVPVMAVPRPGGEQEAR